MVVVVVSVGVFLRANILHLEDITALWAALDWAVARHLIISLVLVLEYNLVN